MGICVICQNFFYSGDWPENKIFLEDSKWKRLWKANSYKSGNLRRQIILDARELEEKYFKNKHDIRHWCALFRVSKLLPPFFLLLALTCKMIVALIF